MKGIIFDLKCHAAAARFHYAMQWDCWVKHLPVTLRHFCCCYSYDEITSIRQNHLLILALCKVMRRSDNERSLSCHQRRAYWTQAHPWALPLITLLCWDAEAHKNRHRHTAESLLKWINTVLVETFHMSQSKCNILKYVHSGCGVAFVSRLTVSHPIGRFLIYAQNIVTNWLVFALKLTFALQNTTKGIRIVLLPEVQHHIFHSVKGLKSF